MTNRITARETPKTAILGVLGATVLALAPMLGLSAPASAQSVCKTHGEVTQELGRRFTENQIAMGLASNGAELELFSSGDGATWSIVVTTPNGVSCVVASGEGWEQSERVALGPEA